MNHIKVIIAVLLLSVLSSCLDTEEKIEINKDHSGRYSIRYDMGRLLKMAGSMGATPGEKKAFDNKDTVISLKELVDASKELSAEQKALFREGTLSIKIDEGKEEMKIEVSAPFNNGDQLSALKQQLNDVMDKLKAFDQVTGDQVIPGDEAGEMGKKTPSINPIQDQFTFTASPGKISNKIINIDAFKTGLAGDSTLKMMTQMTAMLGDFNYRTIIILPSAIKGYDGPGSTLSADKKTVTFVTNLKEIIEFPEKVSYQVSY